MEETLTIEDKDLACEFAEVVDAAVEAGAFLPRSVNVPELGQTGLFQCDAQADHNPADLNSFISKIFYIAVDKQRRVLFPQECLSEDEIHSVPYVISDAAEGVVYVKNNDAGWTENGFRQYLNELHYARVQQFR